MSTKKTNRKYCPFGKCDVIHPSGMTCEQAARVEKGIPRPK